MKRKLTYYLFITLLGFFLSADLHGQRIRGMVIAGGNLTQVEGDEIKGWSQFGFNGGVGAILPFARNWGVNLETLFSQKGSFQKKQFDNDSLTDEYRLRLNYLEVPLYVTYTDKDVLSFGLGGYWGRLLSAREEEHSGNQTPYTDTVQFDKNDIGFLIDFRIRVWKSLHVNVRYSQSLTSIRERYYEPYYGGDPFTRKQYNQVITLRAIYIINEPESQRAPE